ncbi:MAG TPA: YbhB/YbcL family Raf kinase inhibitor-like protein [Polyangiaceae bacterium]
MGAMHSIKSAIGKALRPARSSDSHLAIHKLGATPRLSFSSSAFPQGGPIPRRYAKDGENFSPPLSWGELPAGTLALALLCEDPDAPMPQPFVHWVVCCVPPTTTHVSEGVSELTPRFVQGKNSFGSRRYDGPAPPPGHGVHHYHFQLFALDRELTLGDTPDRGDLVDAMRGHVIAAGDVVGTYER